jgi:hypothetical protein
MVGLARRCVAAAERIGSISKEKKLWQEQVKREFLSVSVTPTNVS